MPPDKTATLLFAILDRPEPLKYGTMEDLLELLAEVDRSSHAKSRVLDYVEKHGVGPVGENPAALFHFLDATGSGRLELIARWPEIEKRTKELGHWNSVSWWKQWLRQGQPKAPDSP